MDNNRLTYISFLRVVAMTMVVLFHCLAYYSDSIWQYPDPDVAGYGIFARFLNVIDMPMFVFISGFLYAYLREAKGKYKDNMAFLTNKARRLMVPYLFWGVVLLLLFPDKHVSDMLSGISHLWFLLMLFGLFLLIHFTYLFWHNLSFGKGLIFLCFLFLLYPLGLKLHFATDYFCIDRILMYLPYFVLGCGCNSFFSRIEKLRYVLAGGLILLVVVFSLTTYVLPLIPSLVVYPIQYLFVGMFLVCCFGYFSQLPSAVLQFRGLDSLDRCSMGIYILHHILIAFPLQWPAVRAVMNDYWWLCPWLMFLVVYALSWMLTAALLRTRLSVVIG